MKLLRFSILLLILSACRQAPPPGASGATIYDLQNCANCHGEAREGSPRGPALFGMSSHWDRAALAEFFEDPKAHAKRDSRLRQLADLYAAEMDTYANLDQSERLRLADYLLERP